MSADQHRRPQFYYPEDEGKSPVPHEAASAPRDAVVGVSGDAALFGAHVQIDGGAPRETFRGGPGSVHALPLKNLEKGSSQDRVFGRHIAEQVRSDGIDAIHHVIRMGDTLVGVTTVADAQYSVQKVRLVALPFGHENPDGQPRTGRIIAEKDVSSKGFARFELGRSKRPGVTTVNDDPLMSGAHATIIVNREGFTIHDGARREDVPTRDWQPSTNGTAVSNLCGLGETSQAADLAAQLQAHPEIWDGKYPGARIVNPSGNR